MYIRRLKINIFCFYECTTNKFSRVPWYTVKKNTPDTVRFSVEKMSFIRYLDCTKKKISKKERNIKRNTLCISLKRYIVWNFS